MITILTIISFLMFVLSSILFGFMVTNGIGQPLDFGLQTAMAIIMVSFAFATVLLNR